MPDTIDTTLDTHAICLHSEVPPRTASHDNIPQNHVMLGYTGEQTKGEENV
jgi:hypothetical protein